MSRNASTPEELRWSPPQSKALWTAVIALVVSSLIATAVASLILVRLLTTLNFTVMLIPLAVALIIMLLAVWSSKALIDENRRRIAEQMEVTKLQSELEIAQKTRELHHDLVNHLSAVSSWIQLGASNRALHYIHRILTDVYPQNSKPFSKNFGESTLLLGMVGQKFTFAQERDIALHVSLDSKWPKAGIKDDVAVRVLGNLVDNALQAAARHEGPDQPRVTVAIVMESNDALFRVWNNGPPIPDSVRQRLEQPLSTVKISKSRGLGLCIVRRLVQEIGGTLSVKSAPRTGTDIQVRFPLPPA